MAWLAGTARGVCVDGRLIWAAWRLFAAIRFAAVYIDPEKDVRPRILGSTASCVADGASKPFRSPFSPCVCMSLQKWMEMAAGIFL